MRVFLAALAWLLLAVIGGVIILAAAHYTSVPARADAEHMHRYHADAEHDTWMRSLIRPDTGTSCCNLNDCRPTEADWRDGQWWAIIKGEWRPIPPEKVVHDPPSIDGEAWECSGWNGTIFCFIPPSMGY